MSNSKLVAKGDRLLRKLLIKAAQGHRVRCVTCSHVAPAEQLQVGHWIGRSKLSVRFDVNNVSLQCQNCNYWHSGRPKEFEAILRRTHGDQAVDDLVAKSNRRMEPGELETIVEEMEQKLRR